MSTRPHHPTPTLPRRHGRAVGGFSLIELTMVIVILGVLMSVVAVNVLGQGEKAKVRASETSMDLIRTQLDSYHLEYSAYPPTLATLQQLKFLSDTKALKDGWKREFGYRVTPDSAHPYMLISSGGDVNDPSDDIDVWTMNQ